MYLHPTSKFQKLQHGNRITDKKQKQKDMPNVFIINGKMLCLRVYTSKWSVLLQQIIPRRCWAILFARFSARIITFCYVNLYLLMNSVGKVQLQRRALVVGGFSDNVADISLFSSHHIQCTVHWRDVSEQSNFYDTCISVLATV